MNLHLLTLKLTTTLFLYFFSTFPYASPTAHDKAQDLVHSSCIHTRYPKLCLRTLSNYPGPTNSPLDIAQAALRVSLTHARKTSKYLRSSTSNSKRGAHRERQGATLSDCKEQIADSVDELQKSLEELQHLRPETFKLQMSNALTWVSAALTDGDTCLDNGNVRVDVKRKVTDVARVTSNALYMINRVGQSGPRKPMARSRSKN